MKDQGLLLKICLVEILLGLHPATIPAHQTLQSLIAMSKNPKFLAKYDLGQEKKDTFPLVLNELRIQRIEQKLHSFRKVFNKLAKRIRAFQIQKCIKKLKEAREEENQAKAQKSEEALTKAKSFNTETLVENWLNALQHNTVPEMINNASVKRDFEHVKTELEAFKALVNHQTPLEDKNQKNNETKAMNKILAKNRDFNPTTNDSNFKDRRMESFFVGSLADSSVKLELETPAGGFSKLYKQNRPGQRARRAMAEAKYGNQARHLQNGEKMEEKIRKKNDQSKRTFKKSADGDKSTKHPLITASHPSWEAKKRQNELLTKTHFQGTKITFDENE